MTNPQLTPDDESFRQEESRKIPKNQFQKEVIIPKELPICDHCVHYYFDGECCDCGAISND